MARSGTCTECGASLAGKQRNARTCSPKCRAARSRRIKRQRDNHAPNAYRTPEQSEAAAIAREHLKDVAVDTLKQELAPVIREELTEDAMRSLREMVRLSPKAIAAMAEDLDSNDSTLRQRAYSLLLKLTLNNGAVVPQQIDGQTGQIVVNLGLPRPGSDKQVAPPGEVVEAEGVDEVGDEEPEEGFKMCENCGETKHPDEFVGESDRCLACHEIVEALRKDFQGG